MEQHHRAIELGLDGGSQEVRKIDRSEPALDRSDDLRGRRALLDASCPSEGNEQGTTDRSTDHRVSP
jgi:hypothetical protein